MLYIISALIGALFMFLLMRSPLGLLLFDTGFRIYTTPDPRALAVMNGLLSRRGYRPQLNIDGSRILRTVFRGGTLLNCTIEDLSIKLPACAIAVVTMNPSIAAAADSRLLNAQGYGAMLKSNFDPESPQGSLVVLETNALTDGIIVYRWPVWRMAWATRKSTSGKPQRYKPRRLTER